MSANNYKAAKSLDDFKAKWIKPIVDQLAQGRSILDDPNHKWKDDEQKSKAQEKLMMLESKVMDMDTFAVEVKRLIEDHENLVSKLCTLYSIWYQYVAYNGRQQKEMMSIQADKLQGIFIDIYEEIKDAAPELQKPMEI